MVDFNKKYRSLVEAFIVCFIAQAIFFLFVDVEENLVIVLILVIIYMIFIFRLYIPFLWSTNSYGNTMMKQLDLDKEDEESTLEYNKSKKLYILFYICCMPMIIYLFFYFKTWL